MRKCIFLARVIQLSCVLLPIALPSWAQVRGDGPSLPGAGCMAGRIEGDAVVFDLPEGRAKFETTFSNGKLMQVQISLEAVAPVFGEREIQTRTVHAAPSGALGSIGLIRARLDGQTGVVDPVYEAGVGIAFTQSGGWAAGVISRGLNCQYRFDDQGAQEYGSFPTSIAYLTDRSHESQLLLADEGLLLIAQTTQQLRAGLEASNRRVAELQAEVDQLRTERLAADKDLAALRAEISRLTGRLAQLSSKRVYSVRTLSKRIGRTLFTLTLRLPRAERAKARKSYRRLQKIIRLADRWNSTTATARGDEVVKATKKSVVLGR